MIKQPQQINLQVPDQQNNSHLYAMHSFEKSLCNTPQQTSHVYSNGFQIPQLTTVPSSPQELSLKGSSSDISVLQVKPYVTYVSSSQKNQMQYSSQTEHQHIKEYRTFNSQKQYFDLIINKEESPSISFQAESSSFINKNGNQNLKSTASSSLYKSLNQIQNDVVIFSNGETASCENCKVEKSDVETERIDDEKEKNKTKTFVNSLPKHFNENYEINKQVKSIYLKDPSCDVMSSSAKGNVPSSELYSSHVIKTESSNAQSSRSVKIFQPNGLCQALMPTLEKLFEKVPESLDFRQPVDPKLLQIPDYFDIIKNPMDLSTIKQKLVSGQYQDPWQYIDDVWLMFDNAWLYNKKASRVYKHCSKLAEIFEQEINPVMQSLGFCCGQKYAFQPQILYCQIKQCIIGKGDDYWSYQNSYLCCQKCFKNEFSDTIAFRDAFMQSSVSIRKDKFVLVKNNHRVFESFVECCDCHRQFHEICVLHFKWIWPEGFICSNCLKKKGQERRKNKFTSKRLQHSKLGQYVEKRVNNFLKQKGVSNEVIVRVIYNSEKFVEVKPGMKARYVDTGLWPEKFPYKAKALFAFEQIDGVDVCFFGMHVQEYDSDCPLPNRRHVYIAYLDSAHFFQPKQCRTAVYHEILLGYLDYVKKLGYTTAYVWACPPREGEDYIFHSHSTEQKVPTPKRLQEWYKKMLDKGVMERIIIDYKNILQRAVEYNLESASELPYFEGDFWPNVLEDSIKELNQDKETTEVSTDETILTNSDESIKKESKSDFNKKCQKNKKNPRKKRRLNPHLVGTDLCAKIYSTMEKYKEIFFVIQLHSLQENRNLSPILDPDPFIQSELMDGRDAFLALCRENHYEFSSLRRAKFSTMALVYELHIQGHVICNNCRKNAETRYHCTICDDFDLCIDCFKKEGHNHRMEKRGFVLDEDADLSCETQNFKTISQNTVSRYNRLLLHTIRCLYNNNTNCEFPFCREIKKCYFHIKECKKKATNTPCLPCKQFYVLCRCHIMECKNEKCTIKFCPKGKCPIDKRQAVDNSRLTSNNKSMCTAPVTNSTSLIPSNQDSSITAKNSTDNLISSSNAALQRPFAHSTSSSYSKNNEAVISSVSQHNIIQEIGQGSESEIVPKISNIPICKNEINLTKLNYKEFPHLQSSQCSPPLKFSQASQFSKSVPNSPGITATISSELTHVSQSSASAQKLKQTLLKLVEVVKTAPSVQQRNQALSMLAQYKNVCKRKSLHLHPNLEQQRKSNELPHLHFPRSSHQTLIQSPVTFGKGLEFQSDKNDIVQKNSDQNMMATEIKQVTLAPHSLQHHQLNIKPSKELLASPSHQPIIQQVKAPNPTLTEAMYVIPSTETVAVFQNQSALSPQQLSAPNLHYTKPLSLYSNSSMGSSSLTNSIEKTNVNSFRLAHPNSNISSYLHNPINQEIKQLSNGKSSCHLTSEEKLRQLVEYL